MSYSSNTPIQFLPNIGNRTSKILHELGVHTAGQLKAIPDEMLVELFGPSIRQTTGLVQLV